MIMSEKDLERIDQYLTNQLSDADRSAFDADLEANSELKREFQMQQDIVALVRDARKLQLKQQLSNIPTPNGNSYMGYSAAILGSAILGTILYFATRSSSDDSIVQNNPEITLTPTIEKVDTVQNPEVKTETIAEVQKDSNPVKPKPELQPQTATKPVVLPTIPDEENEVQSATSNPEPPTGHQTAVEPEEAIVTNVVEGSRYKFHFQLDGSSLHLYGQFNKGTYKILDFIDEQTGKRATYLYYDKVFYGLTPNNVPEQLQPVQDPVVIKRLTAEAAKIGRD